MEDLRCKTCNRTPFEPCGNDYKGCSFDERATPVRPRTTEHRRRAKQGSSDNPGKTNDGAVDGDI